jgi:uncharacterized phage protein (TIGR02218 family)
MRALDPAFLAHLQSGATTLATCWRLQRADGGALGFTDHDRPISFDGCVFEPEAGVSGSALEASSDFSVDNSDIEGALSSAYLSAEDLAAGRYDGAEVEIWRVNWAEPAQRVLLRRAVLGDVTRKGGAFSAELRGLSSRLDRVEGRVFQRLCDAVAGDARCGVDLDAAAYKGAGAVSSVSDAQRFLASGLAAFAAGWFEHGRITWVSGANAGAQGWVKAHGLAANGDASIALWTPAGAGIAPGDAFEIRAGCDRRRDTCVAKFANVINFRGFPDMPGNDAAISYPVKSGRNDGGKR